MPQITLNQEVRTIIAKRKAGVADKLAVLVKETHSTDVLSNVTVELALFPKNDEQEMLDKLERLEAFLDLPQPYQTSRNFLLFCEETLGSEAVSGLVNILKNIPVELCQEFINKFYDKVGKLSQDNMAKNKIGMENFKKVANESAMLLINAWKNQQTSAIVLSTVSDFFTLSVSDLQARAKVTHNHETKEINQERNNAVNYSNASISTKKPEFKKQVEAARKALQSGFTSSRFASQANYAAFQAADMMNDLINAKMSEEEKEQRLHVLFIGGLVLALSRNQHKYQTPKNVTEEGMNIDQMNDLTAISMIPGNKFYKIPFYPLTEYHLRKRCKLELDMLTKSVDQVHKSKAKSDDEIYFISMIQIVGARILKAELPFDVDTFHAVPEFARMKAHLNAIDYILHPEKAKQAVNDEVKDNNQEIKAHNQNAPKGKKLSILKDYTNDCDGKAVIYATLFAESRATLCGNRQFFANTRAALNGTGTLFANTKALLNGEKPLFANTRASLGLLK